MKTRMLWQSCIVAAVGCLASGLTLAQSTVDCSTVAEDRARLKCYDEQAARQKKASAPPAATTSPATAAPPAASAASPVTPAPSARASQPAAAAASGTASPATSAPSAAATSSDFGLNAETIRKRQAAANPDTPKEPDEIVGRVKAVQTKARGEYRITLDDGQVWDETQHSSSTQAPEVGETVTIKRGMLGSYFLSHSAGLALRVKRIN
jgi:hypothetical protein